MGTLLLGAVPDPPSALSPFVTRWVAPGFCGALVSPLSLVLLELGDLIACT